MSLDEVRSNREYEVVRDDFRRRVIELKRLRRVQVGDIVTFVFENRDTVLFQIQEMCRVEGTCDLEGVRREVECYNELLPRPGNLAATMLIEITEPSRIKPTLERLRGILACVRMDLGAAGSVPACFEEGREREQGVAAVQYCQFPLREEQRRAWAEGKVAAALTIEHEHYRARAELSPEALRELAEDLRE